MSFNTKSWFHSNSAAFLHFSDREVSEILEKHQRFPWFSFAGGLFFSENQLLAWRSHSADFSDAALGLGRKNKWMGSWTTVLQVCWL